MSGADEEWVKSAMTDDTVVVELLVRLHHAPPPPPPRRKPAAFPLAWTVRQRRSKSASVNNNSKKPAHRGSPTTPLSWSGATSFSGGSAGAVGGGSEESSRLISVKATRSKVNVDGEKSICKRSRKKKTLGELKDDENMLLKERKGLKREMLALRLNLEREKAINENLKRMKIELKPCLAAESVSHRPQHELAPSHPVPTVSNIDTSSESKFVLPDLNIMFDETSSDVICGVS